MTEQEQIAAFIAARGVTRVEAGTGNLNHMKGRDWRKAAQNGRRINASEPSEAELINRRAVVVDHLGRERVRNGLGEWIA